MPKASVRQAVAEFLDPGYGSDITYLGAVYQALPKVANEADLYSKVPAGSAVGAVIYCFIEDQQEERKAFGGPSNGRKLRTYTLGLLCVFKSDLTDPQGGQAAFDTFIDSLTARIQSDRTAGTGGSPVWQWGEGEGKEAGGVDLRFEYPVPRTLDGGVMLFQAIGRIQVLEWLDT